MDDEQQPKRRGFLLIAGILVLILAVAGGVIAFYGLGPLLVRPVNSTTPVTDVEDALGLSQPTPVTQTNQGLVPIQVDAETMATLMQRIGQQVQLPQHETPQAQQIRDLTQLAGQPFFAQALAEDVLFIFPSRQVVLYRPSNGQVVASGSINNTQE